MPSSAMIDFFTKLFDTSDFPARWHCGNWSDFHGWVHIIGDTAIFGAYAAIPLSIAYFVSKRRDVIFPKLYWLFAAFIFSCGFGHLVEAGIFWHPWYRFSGLVKIATAIVSWATVLALVRILPTALELPGVAKLNAQLKNEVDERRKAEEEIRRLNRDLRQRVEELETLLEVLPVGIGIAQDPEAREIRTNAAFAEMLNLSRHANASLTGGESAPKHFRVYSGGRELGPNELPIQAAASRGKSIREIEEEIVFEDGRRVYALGYAAPLFDSQQAVRGAVGAFIDITARKLAEEERQQVERKLQETQKLESLGVLAGGIAHDFNNLLTGVVGNASLARLELAPSSPLMPHLEQIEQASMRAADLCRQMLAYAGKGRFFIQKLDLSELVRETTYLIQSSINKSATLQFNLATGLPAILADATQIRQIVMNLVINASEAMGERNGLITLTTGLLHADRAYLDTTVLAPELPAGDYAYLEVSDTGSGMSPETLAKIFDPFFTTKFTGRGLGLAAVLGIVRSHHGALKVYSELQRGTTFKVLLPAVEGAPVSTVDVKTDIFKWRGSGLVLVVDDEVTIRNTSTRMLETLGFTVKVASDGEQGIKLFEQYRDEVQVVLLDLTMPHLGGEDTFRELRRVRSDVRVLLMSGFNEQEAVNRFLGKGLGGFLQKPFRLENLQLKLKEILEEKPGALAD